MSTKTERLKQVNSLIQVIGSCGRRFFYYAEGDRYASMEVDHRGRVWFIDSYNGKRIYTHYRGRWRGFTDGGTLKNLVEAFRDYVTTGEKLPRWHLYWPSHYCGGDVWGYGEGMSKVRDAAANIGILSLARCAR